MGREISRWVWVYGERERKGERELIFYFLLLFFFKGER